MLGRLIAKRYRIRREIGTGGMGTVYEALDTDGRLVAVKLVCATALKKSPTMKARFEQEARTADRIDSRHIVSVVDAGTDDDTGRPFMVMSLLDGEDLCQLSKRIGPLPADLALRIVHQACHGLADAHRVGIIHRDIKPANLFLSREPGEIVVKILDFGVAKLPADGGLGLTRTGTMIGSPHYMSPEQARGGKNLDARTDLWSLGIVAYKLLAGRLPFKHIKAFGELLLAICCEPIPRLGSAAPWLKPEVSFFVHRALSVDPAARFASAHEMAVAARGLLKGDDDRIQLASLPPNVICDADEVDTLPWLPTTKPPPITQSLPP